MERLSPALEMLSLEKSFCSRSIHPFLDDVRLSAKGFKRKDLESIFASCMDSGWHRLKESGGHATYKNTLTGAVVGYQAHKNNMPQKHIKKMAKVFQSHIDCLRPAFSALEEGNYDLAERLMAKK